MSGYPTRIPPAVWYAATNHATAVSNASTATDAGIAVPEGFRHEIAHLALTKNCTCTVKLHGYANISNTAARWVHFDTVTFSEVDNEAVLLRGVAAFQRVQTSFNAIGSSGAVNSSFGFSA